MNPFKEYINRFFKSLKVYEDEVQGHSYKTFIHQSIIEFLENETKDTAFHVYLNFFDAYKINMGDKKNQFLDLLDMMLSYEENASILTSKQRDHYVHSVNVFLLGLAIYGNNENYQNFFKGYILNKERYAHAYETDHEEFFYRWGITSLFHDVGYPIEIVSKQANHYLNFLVEVVSESTDMLKKNEVRTFIEYEDFSKFNLIPTKENFESFCANIINNSPIDSLGSLDRILRPVDLLADSISTSFSLDYSLLKEKLDGFVGEMQKHGFVDHGFYSAIIVLQWYAHLMQKGKWRPEYFFTPIVDCASAILLHNYYGNVLQKSPFSLGALSPKKQPLAYLLILCDELQEWNRTAYGSLDKIRITADTSDINISDTDFKIVYVSEKELLGDDFEREKEKLLFKRLDINAIFPNSFQVDSINASVIEWRSSSTPLPIKRPLLNQLEDMAKEIHALYCATPKGALHSEHPEMREWDNLPEDIKYSNLSQARHIADKLTMVGCSIAASNSVANPVTAFTKTEIEALSELEHNRWMEERISSGWRYGEEKNLEQKSSPYLLAWEYLSEEIKELDRNAVRNIFGLLEKAGLTAYRL